MLALCLGHFIPFSLHPPFQWLVCGKPIFVSDAILSKAKDVR